MIWRLIAFVSAAVAGIGAVHADSFSWQTATPESQNMSAAKLDELRDGLAKHGTRDLLVIRHDKIVYEWYANGVTADKQQGTASLAKAIVGGLSLGVAMQDGKIKPTDFAAKFIPEWRNDLQKSKITIAELAEHMSGLSDAEEDGVAHDKLTGWKGEFWKRKPRDPFTVSRDLTPMFFTPGDHVSYSNPGMAMLSYAITAAIQDGPDKDVRTLLRNRIYRPIGIDDKEWTVGYGEINHVNGLDIVANWGGASFVPRAAARIGRLMLHEGDWDGKRILDAAVVRAISNPPEATQVSKREGLGSPSPGYGWWTNRRGAWKAVPPDTYMGAGAGHQLLIVIPSLDMVVVRNGTALSSEENDWWHSIDRLLLTPLGATVNDMPHAQSSVIRSIHFDEDSKIVRKAFDSDNWPITWADDDNLYTSYGDGHGFEPLIKPKLSMGFARIDGGPTNFQGVNIRSETGETTGGGVKGPKASGMLMVDGTLYMWVRNVKNSQLCWSNDHAVTWNWGFKFTTSFGCPAFLNFGKNYAGARDEYVYTYSQDGPGAYEPYDGVVLARVLKSKIKVQSAYEFFIGMGSDGAPNWSSDIMKRAHIFHDARHCERLDVVYAPAIHRYLMTLSFGQGKGWGIFDAPEPWGPWTVAFETHDWGQGETHGYRIPTKWMSADNKEMYLIFSGQGSPHGILNDAFCLRRFTLELSEAPEK